MRLSISKLSAKICSLPRAYFLSLVLFSKLIFPLNGFANEVGIDPEAIVFTDLSPAQLQQLQNTSPDELSSLVTVFTAIADLSTAASPTPIFGSVTFEKNKVVFRPRFAFDENQAYEYQFVLGGERIQDRFLLASQSTTPRAKVTQVYPSADILPENLFKFYIQFNQAMSRGNIYRHIRLLNEANVAVELPFLELTTELWSPDGKRLTLLFDPGRTKQGIKPNRDMGLPLREGKKFTLVISKNWSDAAGQPMLEDFKKVFLVSARDTQQPDIKNWKIDMPEAGSKQALTVTFDEILDFALIQDSISIQNQHGVTISGNISVSDNETRWQFIPAQKWAPGNYSLTAKSYLEDISANSLGRAFEVIRTKEEPTIPDNFSLGFTLQAKKSGTE